MIDARITELTPRPTVAVRIRRQFVDIDMGNLFDEHLPNIAHGIADRGGEIAGPPYARYHEWGPEHADVEMGIPVVMPIGDLRPLDEAQPEEMGSSELPGGPVAVAVHRGPYDGLSTTYDQLRDWIAEQGREPSGAPWEEYVDDPAEVAEADLKTDVVWPLH